MLSGWITAGALAILLGTVRFPLKNNPYCSCVPKPAVEEAVKYAHIVVQGHIIGADTVRLISEIVQDKRGVKVGKHKYETREEDFIRIAFRVETKFKTPAQLPDTIYILTSPDPTSCGYPFMPYLDYDNILREIYNYIIYGEKWMERSLIAFQSGKKNRGIIKETLSYNTFVTSLCMRTTPTNNEELQKLNQLKY